MQVQRLHDEQICNSGRWSSEHLTHGGWRWELPVLAARLQQVLFCGLVVIVLHPMLALQRISHRALATALCRCPTA